MKIGTLDASLLAVYLAAVVAFALWIGRGTRSLADYALAGRDRPWWLLLFSIVATETSTVTFLSIPGFAYDRDLTWLQLGLGFLLGRIAIALVMMPRYFEGSMMTAYQVLERRFGAGAQRAASALFIACRTGADGLRLFLTAIVLQELAGIPLSWAVVAMGLATTSYTLVGGMRAVLWADFIQFVVYMLGGLVAVARLGELTAGGWPAIWSLAGAEGKLRAIAPSWELSDPYVLSAGIVGGVFVTFGSHGVDQMVVQRYLCARSSREASRALVLSGVVVLLQFALFLLIGLGLYAFFTQNPPAQAFDRPDRVFARFIVDWMPPGLLGVLLGAVFSAAMSTLSSSLNSSATAAVNDFYLPLRGRHLSDAALLRATRRFTLLFAALQIGVGIGGQWLTESVVASVFAVSGLSLGILIGVFFLGMFSQAGQRAALIAIGLGLAGMTAVALFTTLAWPWYSVVGSLGTYAIGLAAARLGADGARRASATLPGRREGRAG